MISLLSYRFTPEAEKEYLESYLFYEERQEGLGERFAESIRKKLNQIILNPFLFPKKKRGFHEALVSKTFPFLLIYQVDKSENLVVVTAIFHTSRNPKQKYRRK